ncbi:uncharacterized protein KY384_001798 [Bacidia gigantensis]|uniref:uncharacterized protein n=1 Tax=Bacidia gigantensis TaxID=2732470 RepID=UPI001D04DD01|nr:uncharacterized protein KY384_001798 [Bacidia gigantensis]KAG8533015.1 hypothetical protein KY384_001798 [Bacidia gigantensis]
MSRGIRHEVIEMARSLAAKGQLDWALDISVSPHLPREQDMRLQWSRLPAPPSVYVQPGDRTNSADLITSGDVDQSEGETLSRGLNLVVRLVMEKGTEVRWIGDGGPGTFAQQLLTALGCWCENGLLFLEPRQEENKAKIYLANLTVVFVPAFPNEPVTREDLVAVLGEDHARIRAKPQTRDFSQLKSFLHWTAETGLLHGYMKNVHLAIENRGVQKSWTIKRNHEATRKEIAQEWAGYGWLPGQKYRLSRPCPGDRTVERLPRSQRNFINGQARWRLPGCTMS